MTRLKIYSLIVATYLLLQIAYFSLQWRMQIDQPIMFYAGFLVQHGYIPYRDFFEMNTPGVHLLYGLLGHISNFDEGAIRVIDLVWLGLICAVTWIWMRPFGFKAAWMGLVLFGHTYFMFGPTQNMQRDFLLILPLTAGIAATLCTEKIRPTWRIFWASLCFGLAATIKPHAAIGIVAIFHYLVRTGPKLSGEKLFHSLVRMGSSALAGLALPSLCLMFWLVKNHALGSFLELAKHYWPLYRQITFGAKILPDQDRWGYMFNNFRAFHGISPLFIPIGIGTYAALYHSALTARLRERVLLLLEMIGLYSVYVLIAGQFWDYHYFPFIFFAAQAGGLCMFESPAAASSAQPATHNPQSQSQKWFLTVAAVGTLVMMIWPPADYFRQSDGKRPMEFDRDGRLSEGARYLRQHLRPGDRVQPLDWVGGAVQIMLEARALPATAFLYDFHFYHHISDPYIFVLRERFLKQLKNSAPRFIVQVHRDKRPWVLGEDTTMSFPELEKLLKEQYSSAFESKDYTILERNSEKKSLAAAADEQVGWKIPKQ